MFEEVIEKLKIKDYRHEITTINLFDKMLNETENLKQEFESYGLFEHDIQLIKDLIYADVFKSAQIDPKLSYREKVIFVVLFA